MGTSAPFHEGELAVQSRAGVQGQARRVGGIIDEALTPPARAFLTRLPFVIAGGGDAAGHPWASLRTGAPGFLSAPDRRIVRVGARPVRCDPLGEELHPGAALGLLAIDLGTRRRVRVNGTVGTVGDKSFTIRTTEVFANCQQYIRWRTWHRAERSGEAPSVTHGVELTPEQASWIAAADTFFVASAHPARGADVSDRGGDPGFIHVVGPRAGVTRLSGQQHVPDPRQPRRRPAREPPVPRFRPR